MSRMEFHHALHGRTVDGQAHPSEPDVLLPGVTEPERDGQTLG